MLRHTRIVAVRSIIGALVALAALVALLASLDPAQANPACALPPIGLGSALEADGSRIVMTWQASPCDPDRYAIYRRDMDDAGARMLLHATVPGDALSYLDSDVSAGVTYRYRVRSNDSGRRSDFTDITTPSASRASQDSTDAELSALSLSPGTLDPAFDRMTDSYTASVEHLQSPITLIATASDPVNAKVEFLDGDDMPLADADGNTAGHQVDLAVGENTIKIKVTAEDGLTTRTYTLVVTRAGPNTDLSDLRVNGVSVPGFESDVKYKSSGVQRGVAASVAQATIEGVTDDPDAAVAYLGTDTDEMTDGHQVNLSEGRNEISIVVTAADGVTTRTYLLSVNRGSDAPFGWRAQDDFDTLRAAGNAEPEGLWSDGTTMWVGDDLEPFERLFAYARDTTLRDPDKDSNSLWAVWNRSVRGIWSNGMTMWVADWWDEMIYGYAMDTWQRDWGMFINGLGQYGNGDPGDIWSDGETLWVADTQDSMLYAYRLGTGERDSAKDFNTLTANHSTTWGVWSDGTTIWIGDNAKDEIYAYDLATGKRDPDGVFNTLRAVGNTYISNFWSDGTIMWVSDRRDSKLYAYNMPGNADLSGLSLSAGTLEPAFHRVTTSYAASVEHLQSPITLIATASDPVNAKVEFLDGDDMPLADADGNTAGHQVDLAVGENTIKIKVTAEDGLTTRTYTLVVTRAGPNTDLSDLRVNGVSVPGFDSDVKYKSSGVQRGVAASVAQATIEGVTDDPDAAVAYLGADTDEMVDGHQVNLSEGRNEISIVVTAADGVTTRTYLLSVNRGSDAPFGWRAQDDFDTLVAAGNNSPVGLWSDGTTMWVAEDHDPLDQLFAFARDTRLRDPDKDFKTLRAASNTNVRGIWSDGMTMWVADSADEKLYGYAMDTRRWESGKDINSLVLGGTGSPGDIWSDGETIWVVDKSVPKLNAYRLATGERDSAKDFNTLAGDHSARNAVWSDRTTIWIGDSGQEELYAYDLATGKRDRGSDFNTLKAVGNRHIRYIWSDGTIMWVSDRRDGKLYAYNMPGNADLSGLSLSAGTLEPAFHRVTTSYAASAPSAVSTITVTAPASDAGQATVEFLDASDETLADADLNTAGHQVALAPGENTIKIKVTAEDGATTRTYTLVVTRLGPLEVSFGSPSFSVAEGGSVTVTADLERATERDVAVPLIVTVGSGVSDEDYSGVPENLIFARGSFFATFRFKAEGDLVVEDDEVVTVSFDTLPDGLTAGTPTTTTVTIEDDDEPNWLVSVVPASIAEATESAATVSVSSGGVTFTADRTISLNFVGTATEAVDYEVAAKTLTLAVGEHTVATTVSALDDSVSDLGEQIQVSASLDGSRIGARQVITVVDDDEASEGIVLEVAPNRVNEDAGATTLTVTGTLNGSALTTDTLVSLTLAAGTATATDDYTVASSTASLTIPTGSRSGTANFRLTPVDNLTHEDEETVTISASTTSALTLSPSSLTVTIADDDEPNTTPVFQPPSPTRRVDENSAAGVAVGAPVTAIDADNDRLSYMLAGAGATAFRIDAASGQLRTVSGVDYDHEAADRYTVTVIADDLRGGVGRASVTIQVSDLDEPPPVPAEPTVTPTVGETDGLEVFWIAPSASGRPTLSGYELRYRAGGGSWAGWNHAGTGIVATLNGLKAGTRYEVQVRAGNDEGWSSWSQMGAGSTNAADDICSVDGPTPTEITVSSAPIVIASTTDDYFVLYVTHELDGAEIWTPVSVTRGNAGSTTLAEQVSPLPAWRYRVERYSVSDPADIDGDCIDDLAELDALGRMNPLNPAPQIAITDGATAIPDRSTFETLAFSEQTAEHEYVKFALLDMDTDEPLLYWINSKTHRRHPIAFFLETIGHKGPHLPWSITGEVVYDPNLTATDGTRGVYYFWLLNYDARFTPAFLERVYALLSSAMPLLDDDLPMYIPNRRLGSYRADLDTLRNSRIPLLFNEDVFGDVDFLALNHGVGYGRLRVMAPGERPNPRNVVIYETLPNELPRVAGIITGVPQTPLSHVNLRAVQDGAPNAYIKEPQENDEIDDLVDQFVRYEVAAEGYELRAATKDEVDAHFARSRPAHVQTPERDLTVTAINALSEIGFGDWKAFGVKAANVAELGKLGFPEGAVPDGFAIPFYFYDEFMQHTALGEETVFGKGKGADEDKFTLPAETKLIDAVQAILAHPKFQTDFEIQDEMLDDLRDAIKDAQSPQWMIDALTAMHATYPQNQSLRYRSSTNNEDLPGFSGAGLYDSNSQHPDETVEDGIDKSLKQVFASLWNFRAFSEREFHRIDHLATAMGILVHPNYSDERANGVAVSFDPIRGYNNYYYLNTQLGEDLVTNPEADSEPEEVLLYRSGDFYEVLATSNQIEPGALLMTDLQMKQLAEHLTVIHDHFARLYPARPYAIEIEFKITDADILAIKQARPWVFGAATSSSSSNAGGSGSGSGSGGGGGGGGGPPPEPVPSEADFDWNVTRDIGPLDRDNDLPTDIWSNGKTLWVVENSASGADRVFAYDLQTGERQPDAEFELDRRNRFSHGIWSDGTTIMVADSGQDQLFAYNLVGGERLEERDIELAERNRDPRGIWSDGKTLFVLDSVKDGLFVYDFETGELLAEYPLDKLNKSPRGIWSDGVMLWVSDDGAKRLFAYRIEEGALVRHEDEEFTFRSLLKAGNGDARGIWSDSEVVYVADEQDDKVYTYNLPEAIDARLASLSLSGVEIDEFSPGRLTYNAMAETVATVTTIEAIATQEAATVVIEPTDIDGDTENGHQVALEAETAITITVTSSDGSRKRSYQVLVEKPPCLTRLTADQRLSEVTFVGGSVNELDRCASELGLAAFFHWTGESWLLYAPDAPAFLNRPFRDSFINGVPAGATFTTAAAGTHITEN